MKLYFFSIHSQVLIQDKFISCSVFLHTITLAWLIANINAFVSIWGENTHILQVVVLSLVKACSVFVIPAVILMAPVIDVTSEKWNIFISDMFIS